MDKVVGVLIAGLFIIVLFAGIIIYNVWAYSYVANQTWDWFSIYFPQFSFRPNQTQFAAFFALKSVLFYKSMVYDTYAEDEEKKEKAKLNKVVYFLISPWLLYGVLWVIKQYLA